MSSGLQETSFDAIAKLPYTHVKRIAFLKAELRGYCNTSEMLDSLETKKPCEVVGSEIVERVARDCISRSVWRVTGLSFCAGVPGGLIGLVGGIAGDSAQYLINALRLTQQLAYLYGYDEFWDENDHLVKGAGENVLTLPSLFGLLVGFSLTSGVKAGKTLSREVFFKGATKALPVLGGLVSGAVSYATYKPNAEALHRRLKKSAEARTQDPQE